MSGMTAGDGMPRLKSAALAPLAPHTLLNRSGWIVRMLHRHKARDIGQHNCSHVNHGGLQRMH